MNIIYNDLKKMLRDAGLPETQAFEFSYKPESIEVGVFKGWYVARKYKDHVYIRIHRWRDSEEWMYSSDDGGEVPKQSAAFVKLISKAIEKKQREVAEESRVKYAQIALADVGSDYMARKKIGCNPAIVKNGFDEFGQVSNFIPMFCEWGMCGIQTVTATQKFFIEYQRSKGAYHILGFFGPMEELELPPSQVVAVCEGWATAETYLKLWNIARPSEAVTVLVAFSADNLKTVATLARRRYPDNRLVLAPDNDQWKEVNKGLESATEVSDQISASICAPAFSEDMSETKPTDWNDLFLLSPDTATAQIASHKLIEPPRVFALGFYQELYYLSSSKNPQIMAMTDLSEAKLLQLQHLDYWQTHYGKATPMGGIIIDWMRAKSDLYAKCHAAGLFELSKLRGRGFWQHEGKLILNSGEYIHECATETTPPKLHLKVRDFGSKYVYRQDLFDDLQPLTLDAGLPKAMLETLQILNFRNPTSPHLLLGWLVQSFLSGCTDWRTHIWINGEKGGGKSTIMNYIIEPMLSSWGMLQIDKPTEASIRQNLKNDSLPVLLDEFEPNQHTDNVLKLIRVASTGGTVARGTPSGKALEFTAKFCAIMTSINLPPMDAADESRIEIFQVQQNTSIDWNTLKGKLLQIFNKKSSEQLVWWLVNGGADKVLKEQTRFVNVFQSKGLDGRASMQLASLMGAYSAFVGSVSEELLTSIVENRKVTVEEQKQDYTECLDILLGMSVRAEGREMNVAQAIRKGMNEELATLGVRAEGDDLIVWTGSENLKRQFPAKFKNYAAALLNISGSEKKTQRVGHVPKKCIVVRDALKNLSRDALTV